MTPFLHGTLSARVGTVLCQEETREGTGSFHNHTGRYG
eukprot:CAMPEP_0194370430 /NCGR_PEP_ID=MMETSP0174-20130528/18727_1 /TAXON_ID=216777 /ORGANISM="Proboscia alata, Strain PI-D3" /LENGTH=37 /DNA_ID= /DNA_START= /DNA_END= /DNA_ORIENTATION=